MKIDGIPVQQQVGDLVKQIIGTRGWQEGIVPFLETLKVRTLVKLGHVIDEKETQMLRGELRALKRLSRIK